MITKGSLMRGRGPPRKPCLDLSTIQHRQDDLHYTEYKVNKLMKVRVQSFMVKGKPLPRAAVFVFCGGASLASSLNNTSECSLLTPLVKSTVYRPAYRRRKTKREDESSWVRG
jgi:hypothetical protein